MPILLLTATTTADQLPIGQWLAIGVLAWLAWRLLLIVRFPNAPCGHCNGAARVKHGKYWRPCWWCRGSGRKLRLGRKVWDWVTNARARAK